MTLEATILDDGSRAYNLIGPEGEVLAKGLNEDVALSELAKANENLASERLLVQAQEAQRLEAEAQAQAQSEEGQAQSAEAESAVRLLPVEDRTSTSVVMGFITNEEPTSEQRTAVDALQQELVKAGRTDQLTIVTPLSPTTPSGQAAFDFLQAWQQFTGKQVVFLASASDEPLSFTGVVRKADPNTILLDADGDRNLLALVGHEFTHTLERTNPQLHVAMMEAMRPLVIDWARQEGMLEGYRPEDVSSELVANIVGDSFAHPEFWKSFAQRNPSLFEKLVQAVKEWFARTFAVAAQSEWGTEGFITNLKQMHDIVLSALEQARTAGPEAGVAGPEGQLFFAGRRFDRNTRAKLIELERKGILGKDELTGGETAIGRLGRGFTSASGHEGAPARGSDFPDAVKARDRETHQGFERAREAIQRENPGISGSPSQQGRDLIDYLAGRQAPPEGSHVAKAIAFLKDRVPVVSPRVFDSLKQIDEGRTSRAFLSGKGSSVYKLVTVRDNGKVSGYLPEDVRFDRKLGAISIRGTDQFSVFDLFDAIDLSNQEGSPVFTEIAGVTQDGDIVLKQPYIKGLIEATNPWQAIERLGLQRAGDIEGTHARGRIGDTEVLFGDLHKANIMTDPQGNPYFIDALATRALTKKESEIIDRGTGKLPPKGVSFASRRSKRAQARVEGVSREESIAAAFERIHAEPKARLSLLERIKSEYERVRAENAAAEAGVVAPAPVEPTAQIAQLEAQETKVLEDLDVAEQDALDRSSQEIGDRYGERILLEQDVVKRRALERESKAVAAEKRKGIEKQFGERRKAIEADFRRQQQAVRIAAEQATLAATKEGAAQLAEMRRVHAFAELNALVKALPPEVRGRIGGGLTLAQIRTTETSLTDFLVQRIAMIDRVLEAALQKEYLDRVSDLLEATRPKKAANRILKSTLGPEAQRTADMARAAAKFDAQQTADRMTEVETALTAAEQLSPERQESLIEEWGIVNMFGDLENRNAEQLAAAYDMLNQTVQTGRSAWRILEDARRAKTKAQVQELIAKIGGFTREGINQKEMESRIKAWTGSFILSHASFVEFLGTILPDASFLKDWQNKTRRGDNTSQDMARKAGDRLTEHMRTTLGIDSRSAFARMLWSLKEVQQEAISAFSGRMTEKQKVSIDLARKLVRGEVDLTTPITIEPVEGEFEATGGRAIRVSESDLASMREALNALPSDTRKSFITYDRIVSEGVEEKTSMSKLEAIQYLLSWNQPDVREKMRAEGWIDQSVRQMEELTSDPASQAVMAFLRKEYADTYGISNKVYRTMFGMDMPSVANYAPTRYRHSGEAGDIAPFGGVLATSGLTPGYAKTRVSHNAMMRQMDGLTVYWQHIAQQSQWTQFAEFTRELRGVFGNKDIRNAMEQKYGQHTLQQIDKWIDALSTQGGNKSSELLVNQWVLDGLISAKAISSLGFNLRSVFAQLDSAMRAVFAMPMSRIAKAMLDPNFIANIPKAWHSDTIQRRVRNGASPEARYLFEQTRTKPSAMLELGRLSMLPIQYTDGFLTSLTSAIVYTDSYNQAIENGMTPEEAERIAADDMDDAVYRYSQPTGLGSRSLQELTGDRWKKAFMMFMSDARLKTALYMDAGRRILSGKGTKDDVRRIIMVHGMAVISQLAINAYKDAFTDDDDEDIWTWASLTQAAIMGPFQGLLLLGSAGDAVANKLLTGRYFAPSRDPLIDALGRADRAWTHWEDAFQLKDREALIKEWDNIARSVAVHPVTAPISVIVNLFKPIVGLIENIETEE